MNTTPYGMNNTAGAVTHFPGRLRLVRDGLDNADSLEQQIRIQARVRSGDYPMTLATELDKLAQSIAAVGGPEAVELERLVNELLYIHKHFTIVRKSE